MKSSREIKFINVRRPRNGQLLHCSRNMKKKIVNFEFQCFPFRFLRVEHLIRTGSFWKSFTSVNSSITRKISECVLNLLVRIKSKHEIIIADRSWICKYLVKNEISSSRVYRCEIFSSFFFSFFFHAIRICTRAKASNRQQMKFNVQANDWLMTIFFFYCFYINF